MLEGFAARNGQRIARLLRGQPGDVVPIYIAFDSTFCQEFAGITAEKYFSDPDAMLSAQLAVHGRFHGLPHLSPSFFPCLEASALGCEVSWAHSPLPGVRIKRRVRDMFDARRLRVPDPSRDGLMPRALSFLDHFHEKLAGRKDVTINLYDGMGPFDLACLLRETSDVFLDVHQNPRLLHRVLEVATQTCIKWIETVESRFGKQDFVLTSSDYGAFLSPEAFDEFVAPYARAVYDAFPRRIKVFHGDGAFSQRHLPSLARLGTDVFLLFSPKLDIRLVRKALPGVCLVGNIDPFLFMKGIKSNTADIKARALAIAAEADRSGLIIAPGGWLGAGTRTENVDVLIEAGLELE